MGNVDNRWRTWRGINMHLLDFVNLNEAGFPIVGRSECIPDDMAEFVAGMADVAQQKAAHFYAEDYRFERIWNTPEKYLSSFRRFGAVVQPDFSFYIDTPEPVQAWNKFRNNLLAAWWQSQGIEVIPNLRWGMPSNYDVAFSGLPQGGVFATSAMGMQRDRELKELWRLGMQEAIERLRPDVLLLWGDLPEFDFGDLPVIRYTNSRLERQREHGRRKRKAEQRGKAWSAQECPTC